MSAFNPLSQWDSRSVLRVKWTLTGFLPTASDSAFPIGGIYLPDKSVQVQGDLGTAVVVSMQGSNASTPTVSTTWGQLHDAQGNALTLGTTSVEVILENPRWIRPYASACTGSTFTVTLVAYGAP